MRRFALRILRLYCEECRRVIWFWQGRCGHRHRTCMHGSILVGWRRNLDATGGPAEPWACSWCGTRPTEGRP